MPEVPVQQIIARNIQDLTNQRQQIQERRKCELIPKITNEVKDSGSFNAWKLGTCYRRQA
ncbi:hypothetical protein CGZ80_17540 [Rhodopirellula sp. MGV]|nr:hypothetical protein CGZ80_17540 [Rhodopirellula sp. MGV]PNY37257.1 hypothetical protein C2E31_08840 [Rhodopirellula baltica]